MNTTFLKFLGEPQNNPICPIGEALESISKSNVDGRIVPMVNVSGVKINADGSETYGVISMSRKRYEKLTKMSGKTPIIHQTPISFGKSSFIQNYLHDQKNKH